MDVKTTFLKDELGEEVYVSQPPGFIDGAKYSKVLRLHRHSMDSMRLLELGTPSLIAYCCRRVSFGASPRMRCTPMTKETRSYSWACTLTI